MAICSKIYGSIWLYVVKKKEYLAMCSKTYPSQVNLS